MPNIGIAAGILAVGFVASSVVGAIASNKAAKQGRRAQNQAIEFQQGQLDQQRSDQLAQIQTGQAATRTLAGTADDSTDFSQGGAVGPGLDVDRNTEFFEFRQEQGERAINRALAGRGQFFSGAAFEQLQQFNSQLSGEQTERDRNRLEFLATLGSQSASNVGQQATQLTAQTSQSLTNRGIADAQGTLGVAGAVQGGIGGVTGLANNKELITSVFGEDTPPLPEGVFTA